MLTLRSVAIAQSDGQGGARVDGEALTITTDRRDPAIVVAGLPPGVDVRDVDGFGAAVGRAIRRA